MFPIDVQCFHIAVNRVFRGTILPQDVRQVSYRMRKPELMRAGPKDVHSFSVVSKSNISMIEVSLYLSQTNK